jgi:hypothetical protein
MSRASTEIVTLQENVDSLQNPPCVPSSLLDILLGLSHSRPTKAKYNVKPTGKHTILQKDYLNFLMFTDKSGRRYEKIDIKGMV